MNTEEIVEAIDDEIQKLQQARHLLNGIEPDRHRTVRKYRKGVGKSTSVPSTVAVKKIGMSPEGRKRIADAMRARWAAKKQAVKAIKSVKK